MRERTAALPGVVVSENAWKPGSNSWQWHTLGVNVASQSGAVQLDDMEASQSLDKARLVVYADGRYWLRTRAPRESFWLRLG